MRHSREDSGPVPSYVAPHYNSFWIYYQTGLGNFGKFGKNSAKFFAGKWKNEKNR